MKDLEVGRLGEPKVTMRESPHEASVSVLRDS
jgi:hypothetical protein